MSTGDVVWGVLALVGVVFEIWAIFWRGEWTLTRVTRRVLGIAPLRWWRVITAPLVWVAAIWLAWHFTA